MCRICLDTAGYEGCAVEETEAEREARRMVESIENAAHALIRNCLTHTHTLAWADTQSNTLLAAHTLKGKLVYASSVIIIIIIVINLIRIISIGAGVIIIVIIIRIRISLPSFAFSLPLSLPVAPTPSPLFAFTYHPGPVSMSSPNSNFFDVFDSFLI